MKIKNNTKLLLSIIIPCFNEEKTIERIIKKILKKVHASNQLKKRLRGI